MQLARALGAMARGRRWAPAKTCPRILVLDFCTMVICGILCARLVLAASKEASKTHQKTLIPIGSMFDQEGDPSSKSALWYAVSTTNQKANGTGVQFSILSDDVDLRSPFKITSRMCAQMSAGIFAMYGSTSFSSYHTCFAHSHKFHIPFITPDLAGPATADPQPYMLFAKPVYHDAIVEIIQYYGWRSFDYVFDSGDGLHRAQYVYNRLKASDEYIQIAFRRIDDVTRAHELLRSLDYKSHNEYRNVVLDLSSYRAYKQILRQIPEVGMNRDGYHYVLGTMDMLSMDISRFRHGGVNLTGFQLVNYSSSKVKKFMAIWKELGPSVWPGAGTELLQLDAALSVDGLEAIRQALVAMITEEPEIFKHNFRRGGVYNMDQTEGVPCNHKPPLAWMHGEEIYKALKKVDFQGLTGRVKFNESGFRTDFSLEVITVRFDEGLSKIGSWHEKGGLLENDVMFPPHPPQIFTDANFTFYPDYQETRERKIIATILQPPFLMMRRGLDDDGRPFVGNERFKGYVKELADTIKKKLQIDYSLEPVTDGEYGRELPNGSWTGVIGKLTRREADMAIAPLTITAARERVVDFSKPFMEIGVSIMSKRPIKAKPGLFSFMEPFALSLWTSIVLAYITISLTIYFVSRLSPYEWTGQHPTSEAFRSSFTLCNSFWFTMGALMLQGSELCPRSVAGRIVGGAWWFFVLIIISSYTANLAAFLTIERMVQPIESADDLVKQTRIAYGILDSGSTREFFESSNVSTYRQMWNYMSSASLPVMVQSLEAGVEKVQKSGGKYAFLLESSYNEYFNNRRPCDTIKVGPNLNLEGFGIATPHGSDLRDDLNYVCLRLKEDGTLHRLKEKWWEEEGECGAQTGNKESKMRSLSLSNVVGAFLLLIGGLVFAIGTGLVEARYFQTQTAKREPEATEDEGRVHELSNGYVANVDTEQHDESL